MVKISLIVPVYNTEKYLERCINSLINQTLKEIEIILINDGSKDSSLEICNKYAEKDKRIIVIDKLNEGVSKARNIGLDVAKGEYIGFIDSDDFIDYDMYNKMYNRAVSNGCDVVVSGFNIHKNGKTIIDRIDFKKQILNREEIHNDYILPLISLENLNYNSLISKRSVWQYIYKKSIIVNNSLKFVEGLPIGEDFIFNIEVLGKAKRMYILDEPLYNYIIYNTSATQRYRENLHDINLKLRDIIKLKYYDIYGNKEVLEKRIKVLKINHILSEIINECKSNNTKKVKKNNIINLVKQDDIKIILAEKEVYSNVSIIYKVIYFFINHELINYLIFIIKMNEIVNKYKFKRRKV